MRHQLTGNAGLYHVAWQLSRRGWHVMPTVRNARGADLFAVSGDETRILPIQSKALSKRVDVPLGAALETLRSPWWVITLGANDSKPQSYVLTLDEVRAGAHRNINAGGQVSHWLPWRIYTAPAYAEAWERLGAPH